MPDLAPFQTNNQPDTDMGDSMKLGGGGRFKALTGKLESQGHSPESAKKIAAAIGWQKYGPKFGKLAAKARGH